MANIKVSNNCSRGKMSVVAQNWQTGGSSLLKRPLDAMLINPVKNNHHFN